MIVIFITALILGLTSSLHCIGMCGPIALIIPIKRDNNLMMTGQILLYNLGRILTYGLIGTIIGAIGFSLKTFQILQWVSVISGVLLIAFAWRRYLGHFRIAGVGFSFINGLYGKMARSQSKTKLLGLGIVNGLLPCGMVYIALLNAILAGNMLEGGFSMVLFGLGTVPAMFFVSFSANKISIKARTRMNTVIPYILTTVGLLVVLRGLNLGIPYMSPEINITKQQEASKTDQNCKLVKQENTVQLDCCHPKK